MSMLPLLLALCAFVGDQDLASFALSGRTLDPSGRPISGAQLAMQWTLDERGKLAPQNPVTSDSNGYFTGEFVGYGGAFAVMAFDKGRYRGAFVIGSNEDRMRGLDLTLKPTVDLRLNLTSGAEDRRPPWAKATFRVGGLRVPSVLAETTNGRLRVRLPCAEYAWEVYDRDFVSREGSTSLPCDRSFFDLGTIDLAPSYLTAMEGRVLPEWKVTDARGISVGQAALSRFRGKWLLVEFWGFW